MRKSVTSAVGSRKTLEQAIEQLTNTETSPTEQPSNVGDSVFVSVTNQEGVEVRKARIVEGEASGTLERLTGAGILSVAPDNIPDANDVQFILAGYQATNILEEFIEVLQFYVEVWHMDDLVTKIQGVQKLLQMRFYKHPKSPFAKGDLIIPFKLVKSGSKDPKSTTATDVEIAKSEKEREEYRKIVSRSTITEYIYSRLPTYRFVSLVAGGLNEISPDSLLRQNLFNQLYVYWMHISSNIRQKVDDPSIETFKYKLVPENFDAFLSYKHEGAMSMLEQNHNLRLDMVSPHLTSENLLSSVCLMAKHRAWDLIRTILIQSRQRDPRSKGMIKSAQYVDGDTKVPCEAFMFLFSEGDSNLLTEYALITSVFISLQKELSGSRQMTQFEFTKDSIQLQGAISALKSKLALIGFAMV